MLENKWGGLIYILFSIGYFVYGMVALYYLIGIHKELKVLNNKELVKIEELK